MSKSKEQLKEQLRQLNVTELEVLLELINGANGANGMNNVKHIGNFESPTTDLFDDYFQIREINCNVKETIGLVGGAAKENKESKPIKPRCTIEYRTLERYNNSDEIVSNSNSNSDSNSNESDIDTEKLHNISDYDTDNSMDFDNSDEEMDYYLANANAKYQEKLQRIRDAKMMDN